MGQDQSQTPISGFRGQTKERVFGPGFLEKASKWIEMEKTISNISNTQSSTSSSRRPRYYRDKTNLMKAGHLNQLKLNRISPRSIHTSYFPATSRYHGVPGRKPQFSANCGSPQALFQQLVSDHEQFMAVGSDQGLQV